MCKIILFTSEHCVYRLQRYKAWHKLDTQTYIHQTLIQAYLSGKKHIVFINVTDSITVKNKPDLSMYYISATYKPNRTKDMRILWHVETVLKPVVL